MLNFLKNAIKYTNVYFKNVYSKTSFVQTASQVQKFVWEGYHSTLTKNDEIVRFWFWRFKSINEWIEDDQYLGCPETYINDQIKQYSAERVRK